MVLILKYLPGDVLFISSLTSVTDLLVNLVHKAI